MDIKIFLYPTDSIKEVEYMRVKSHKDNPLLEFYFMKMICHFGF